MIQVLDQHTIDKIAAGEVVERPASVVKELVENAIDAGANAITVEIKDGGTSLIRITDNGCGIPADQVSTAFLRHATSKIRTIEDLLTASSLGFRGEALSSIAAVSQVELITKTHDSLTGIRYEIHGGKEITKEEIGCPDGTTFLVRNLFYNTPARRNFLKTAMTEAGYVTELIEQLALAKPEISFKYVVNGQNKLSTSGNGNRKDIIYSLYGRDISNSLLPIEASFEEMHVQGYIAKPYISRGNRSFEHYFVNGRYIKSPIITKAIEEAYKTFVMVHKFPFVVLDITVDSKLLDVNVHPRKMEMRYSNGEQLYRFLFSEIRGVLLQKELIPEVKKELSKEEKQAQKQAVKPSVPEPFETKRRMEVAEASSYQAKPEHSDSVIKKELIDAVLSAFPDKSKEVKENVIKASDTSVTDKVIFTNSFVNKTVEEPTVSAKEVEKPEQLSFFEAGFLSEEARPKHRLIGQLFKTYWLIEYDKSLYIMDQHAAHEKVNYEKFMKQYEERSIVSQQVSPPIVVTVNPRQIEAIQTHQKYFEDMGFQLESFGGNEYMLRAVPLETYGLIAQDIFIEFVDSLVEDGSHVSIDMFIYRIASMACKAAIKGNMSISVQEADALIDQLLQCENPYNCPHGRPTLVSMTQYEIDRKFKRIQDK